MHLRPVERVDASALAEAERSVRADPRPVVIRGGARGWPAMSAWSMAGLKQKLGAVKIPVRETDDEFAEFFGPRRGLTTGARKMVPLAAYVDSITSPAAGGARPPYAGNISIQNDPAVARKLGHLAQDCRFPAWLSENTRQEHRLWIGAAGQRSTIHNDPYHNFNAQIVGRKRFILFAPTQHPRLYPRFFHVGMWSSPVDPLAPDLERYPRFADAEAIDCELEEGDLLYLPIFWWHYVEARTASININRWVHSAADEESWWHRQPQARPLIAFDDMLAEVRRQFESLPAEVQTLRRPEFSKLEAEVAALASARATP